MSTGYAFRCGWLDRLQGLPPHPKHAFSKRAATAYAYERGRHTAALYMMEEKRADRTINTAIEFKAAYKQMSKALRALIRAEQKFVSMPKRKSALQKLMEAK